MSGQENEHTVEKCPFGLTITGLKNDVSEIKKALIGEVGGAVGMSAKVNILWWAGILIVILLLIQVAPVLAHVLGIKLQ